MKLSCNSIISARHTNSLEDGHLFKTDSFLGHESVRLRESSLYVHSLLAHLRHNRSPLIISFGTLTLFVETISKFQVTVLIIMY